MGAGATVEVLGQVSGKNSFSNDAFVATNYYDDYLARGQAYAAENVLTLTTALNNIVVDLSAVTRKPVFLPFNFTPDAGAVVATLSYSDSTTAPYSTTGTAMYAANRNQYSTSVSTNQAVILANTVSSSSHWTDFAQILFGSGGGKFGGGGGAGGSDHPIWLKQGRYYRVSFVPETTDTTKISSQFYWVEIE